MILFTPTLAVIFEDYTYKIHKHFITDIKCITLTCCSVILVILICLKHALQYFLIQV